MNDEQRKAMWAKREKTVNDYNKSHLEIQKMLKKDYSDVSKGEYARKVKHYHNMIRRYESTFNTKPDDVIKLS